MEVKEMSSFIYLPRKSRVSWVFFKIYICCSSDCHFKSIKSRHFDLTGSVLGTVCWVLFTVCAFITMITLIEMPGAL